MSTPRLHPARVLLADLSRHSSELDKLLVKPEPLRDAGESRPDLVVVLVCSPRPRLSTASRLRTVVIQVDRPGGPDPLGLASGKRDILLRELADNLRRVRQLASTPPFDPISCAADVARISTGCELGELLASRWRGRDEQRAEAKLFWLGSRRPFQPKKPAGWVKAASEAGLLAWPPFAESIPLRRGVQRTLESVDEMRELLERHAGQAGPGKCGEVELVAKDDGSFVFEGDPLDSPQ